VKALRNRQSFVLTWEKYGEIVQYPKTNLQLENPAFLQLVFPSFSLLFLGCFPLEKASFLWYGQWYIPEELSPEELAQVAHKPELLEGSSFGSFSAW
jgi:hypothetical protein